VKAGDPSLRKSSQARICCAQDDMVFWVCMGKAAMSFAALRKTHRCLPPDVSEAPVILSDSEGSPLIIHKLFVSDN